MTHLSITDHDTLGAYAGAGPELPEGFTLIPGIELSALCANRCVHILGLNVNPAAESMQQAVAIQTRHRQERAEKIADKLTKLGIADSFAGASALASDVPGRPHFARHLVATGVCESENSAFKTYLGDNKPAFVKQAWPEMADVIHWIKSAGGIAVLAHPAKYDMTRRKICKLVAAFQGAGGQALELLCGRQTPQVTQTLLAIAQEYNLHASIGSDFHSPAQTWLKLGMHRALPKNCIGVWEAF